MTRSFRFPQCTVFGSLFLGLVLAVLASDPAGAVSLEESSLFNLAAHDKDNGTVRQLLAEKVSPNVPMGFHDRTAVHSAAKGGAAQNLAAMLEAGGKPNVQDRDGNTPLHLASMGSFSSVFTNHAAAVRVLLQHGANLHQTNDSGETPLHVATHTGVGSAHADVIRALLAAGARPQQADGNGVTALQRFVRHGSDDGEIVALLLKAGANPDQKDSRGDAPLHAAIKTGGSNGKADVVEALLDGGANPCVRDDRGYTPYHLADSRGMTRSRQALDRAYGFDASHAGDSGCQLGSEDGPKLTDKGGAGKGEKGVKESGASARPSSWPPAVAGLEQQMVTVRGNVQLSKYEVTQALWEAVMGTNPSYFQGCGQCPVDQVSWDDAQVFLGKLNALTGEQYRLPTEAEWAGALRSGGGAWYDGNSGGRTHPVGQKAPNEVGLYDMKGNVWEWMEDCWEGDCRWRVVRGGSCFVIPEFLRSALRFRLESGDRLNYYGFRVARTLTP